MTYEYQIEYLDNLNQEQEDNISIALEADGADDGYRGIPLQSTDPVYVRGYNVGTIAKADAEFASFQRQIRIAKENCDRALKDCREMGRMLDDLKFQDWLDENF
ncbi:MAG: hypothetical protein CLLPBCKN_000465 [Chroococcidiopsis cubana SAG 39.79]|uniref:Uncharacterized protein n=1 Tax=Chroococcidiopsis cubana SAG 39.79 TaxID=388085 RepID=A0AB37UP38_9CYAN|nr:hypothetical protein [Chroococcidiopsis cubana]MDZ4871077.1 hypothetical protein [Chroococcidiopsis cubana SAG 39.79]PSB64112.1 hypothetical protein C7B79_11160 [Chroococcidiopsis cubana CCALA 043]RUT13145.1 hypothetical protein DSM107010_17010 [Chroococcidiopsis cubana SAG 39.79]